MQSGQMIVQFVICLATCNAGSPVPLLPKTSLVMYTYNACIFISYWILLSKYLDYVCLLKQWETKGYQPRKRM